MEESKKTVGSHWWKPTISSNYSGGFRHKGHSLERVGYFLKAVAPVFDNRRAIAPQSAVECCSVEGSETAADLLLDFEHPDVALGLIVVERNAVVMPKAQDCLVPMPETEEEIALVAFGSASAPRLRF